MRLQTNVQFGVKYKTVAREEIMTIILSSILPDTHLAFNYLL